MSLVASLRRLFAPETEIAAAEALYREIVQESRKPEWFAAHGVEDTPAGRYEMLVLCAAKKLKALREEGNTAASRVLIETMIRDFDHSLREMGVGDLGVGKKVKRMSAGAYERFRAYESAMLAGEGALASSIKRYVFADKPEYLAQAAGISAKLIRA